MTPPHPENHNDIRERYVREVIRLYKATPGVIGRVRRSDRQLAYMLFEQHVPIYALRYAFILAASRRAQHNAFSAPLTAIRSLHYFMPVVKEVRERPPGYREIEELRRSLGACL